MCIRRLACTLAASLGLVAGCSSPGRHEGHVHTATAQTDPLAKASTDALAKSSEPQFSLAEHTEPRGTSEEPAIIPGRVALLSPRGAGQPDQSEDATASEGHPYPIDLPTALRLANVQNTQIILAQQRIDEASAQLDQTRLLLLPTLSAGASYHHHDGRLQDVAGNILEVSRSSGYAGLGAGAVAAGSVSVPGVSVRSDLADAIFLPLVARQNSRAREAESRAVSNNVLLSVVIAYQELLRAKVNLAIAEETYRNATELARVTDEFALAGEGLQSDAERAAVEQALREKNVEEARESLLIRSAQLAELLRLDPRVELEPIDGNIAAVAVVQESQSLADLIGQALLNRPELEQSHALVQLACERLRQAKYGPLLPSVLLGYSVGGFGGGQGSRIGDSSERGDVDALMFWELRNLGLGDRALTRERNSQFLQAQTTEVAVMDRVSLEVSQAYAQVTSRRKQIPIAESAVRRALRSFQLNRTRIFEKQGLPIEVLQAIQSLATTRREYLTAVIDYNQAQFRLYTALGLPAHDAQPQGESPAVATPVVPRSAELMP